MRVEIVVVVSVYGVENDGNVTVLKSHDRYGRAVIKPNDSVRLESAWKRCENSVDVVERAVESVLKVMACATRNHSVAHRAQLISEPCLVKYKYVHT